MQYFILQVPETLVRLLNILVQLLEYLIVTLNHMFVQRDANLNVLVGRGKARDLEFEEEHTSLLEYIKILIQFTKM